MSAELFFSIIVPAHNEERYIEDTICHIEASMYPKDRYEVIVVENGSEDNTFARANALAQKLGPKRIRIFSIPEAGVSKARNVGITKARPDSDWIFFLDADTYFDPPFLPILNEFLQTQDAGSYAVGTAELQPYPRSGVMDLIYWWTNFFFRWRGTAYGGALFVRRNLLAGIAFDEQLQMGEDEVLAKKVRAFGKFFFLNTKLVHTSTRRYQDGGWKKIPGWVGLWLFAMIVPKHGKFIESFQRRLKYKVVR